MSSSALAALVAAEERMDRELAEARTAAARAAGVARRRAEAAGESVDDEIAQTSARLAREIEAETAAKLRAIADDAHAQLSRFAAPSGDALVHALVERLVAIAMEGEP